MSNMTSMNTDAGADAGADAAADAGAGLAFDVGPGDALLVVDLQEDFLPGGALGVAGAEALPQPVNMLTQQFSQRKAAVVASGDWHPAGHCSFHAQGGPWPSHCVAGTHGAELAAQLHLPEESLLVHKGTGARQEAYSAFQDTGLDEQLHRLGVHRLFVVGVATEYCVLNTVRDARRLGYEVVVLPDLVRAVDPEQGRQAIASMQAMGARLQAAGRLH